MINLEEDRFRQTLDAGLAMLEKKIEELSAEGAKVLSGAEAFKLYDTYGFPVDLTREIAAEAGLALDEEGFTALMNEQKNRARAARGNISGWSKDSLGALSAIAKTEFLGYESLSCEGKLLAILVDGESVDSLSEGEATLVFDKTVFYGEGGGQVGDKGTISLGDALLSVTDTKKIDGVYLHMVTLENGIIRVGDVAQLAVASARRAAIARNHTAAHLLQSALRAVLGSHVKQAGSYVDENEMRFDFSQLSAMTAEEIARTEALVNEAILLSEPVVTTVTDMEGAKALGAIALFDEKYGESVRVLQAGSTSTELCGGTHVKNTGAIGLFKITAESSVAAGVRRISAVTGLGVLSLLNAKDALLTEAAKELKCPTVAGVAAKASALQAELKESKRALESLQAKLANQKLEGLLSSFESVKDFRVLTAKLEMRPDAVRGLCDQVKEKEPMGVCVFAAVMDGKLNFVAAAGAEAVKAGAHAGKILSEISVICGGKGGGRPDSAMSGGKDLDKIEEALAKVKEILAR